MASRKIRNIDLSILSSGEEDIPEDMSPVEDKNIPLMVLDLDGTIICSLRLEGSEKQNNNLESHNGERNFMSM